MIKALSKYKGIVIALAVIMIAAAVGFFIFKDEITYKQGVTALSEKDYRTAKKKFESLDAYKDSKDLLTQAHIEEIEQNIDVMVNESLPSTLGNHKYSSLMADASKLMNNQFFALATDTKKKQVEDIFHYMEFLFNLFKSTNILVINCFFPYSYSQMILFPLWVIEASCFIAIFVSCLVLTLNP